MRNPKVNMTHDELDAAVRRAWEELIRYREPLVRWLTESERDKLRDEFTKCLSREFLG